MALKTTAVTAESNPATAPPRRSLASLMGRPYQDDPAMESARARTEGWLFRQVTVEPLERAPPRVVGALGVVGRALVVVEAVAGVGIAHHLGGLSRQFTRLAVDVHVKSALTFTHTSSTGPGGMHGGRHRGGRGPPLQVDGPVQH